MQADRSVELQSSAVYTASWAVGATLQFCGLKSKLVDWQGHNQAAWNNMEEIFCSLPLAV